MNKNNEAKALNEDSRPEDVKEPDTTQGNKEESISEEAKEGRDINESSSSGIVKEPDTAQGNKLDLQSEEAKKVLDVLKIIKLLQQYWKQLCAVLSCAILVILVFVISTLERTRVTAYELIIKELRPDVSQNEDEANTSTDSSSPRFKPEQKPLEGVVVKRSLNKNTNSTECTSAFPAALYRCWLFTGDVTSDERGEMFFLKSPCVDVSFSKKGYQRVIFQAHPDKTPADSVDPDSNGDIFFQQEIKKVNIVTNPPVVMLKQSFKYNISFSNQKNELVYLLDPKDTFQFSDTLNTIIKIPSNDPIAFVNLDAQMRDRIGNEEATVTIRRSKLLPIHKPISIRNELDHKKLYEINRAKNTKSLSCDATSVRITHPLTWLTVCNPLDFKTPHNLKFTYSFSNSNETTVVEFMGVKFFIGSKDQSAITILPSRDNIATKATSTPEDILLSNSLPSNRLIHVSIKYNGTQKPININKGSMPDFTIDINYDDGHKYADKEGYREPPITPLIKILPADLREKDFFEPRISYIVDNSTKNSAFKGLSVVKISYY